MTTEEPSAVFDLLSDPTRVAIVRELATAQPLRFSDLARRTDAGDTGRFNYHLRRLRGELIEKAPEGYVLTPAGRSATHLLDARPEL